MRLTWWDWIVHLLRFRCGFDVVGDHAVCYCNVCAKKMMTPEAWENLRITRESQ